MIRPLPSPIASLVLPAEVWLDLDQAVVEGIRARRETCRILIGSVVNRRALAEQSIACHNRSADPSHFSVLLEDIEKVQQTASNRGLRVLALIHTHPPGMAGQSLEDAEMPRTTGLLSVVAAADKGAIRVGCYSAIRDRIRPVPVEFLPLSVD